MLSADYLIQTVKRLREPSGRWTLTRDEILDLLGTDIREAYPLIVNSKDPLVSFSTSEYGSESTGVLISLLECLGFDSAADEFWCAGLWIPYTIQIELQESLVREISIAAGDHRIDYHALLSMFDTYSEFIRTTNCYLEEFFSKEELVLSAVGKLLDEHPETSYESAALSLKLLAGEFLRRELIPYRDFFTGLFIKMKARLIAEGRMEPEFEKQGYAEGGGSPAERRLWKEREAAGKLFGYDRDHPVEKQDLKQRYKRLMKQFHPDVNPEGLEMAKRINRAYGLLIR